MFRSMNMSVIAVALALACASALAEESESTTLTLPSYEYKGFPVVGGHISKTYRPSRSQYQEQVNRSLSSRQSLRGGTATKTIRASSTWFGVTRTRETTMRPSEEAARALARRPMRRDQ